MLKEIMIIIASLLLSLLYKKRIEITEKDKKYMFYVTMILSTLFTYFSLYYLLSIIFLALYKLLNRKELIYAALIFVNLLSILLGNLSILILLPVYNSLIIWLI